jgi:hypothetical protein
MADEYYIIRERGGVNPGATDVVDSLFGMTPDKECCSGPYSSKESAEEWLRQHGNYLAGTWYIDKSK